MADAKKPVKKGKSVLKYKKYSISGETLTRAGRACPKCGPAVFMGEHKNRYACGKCAFTEIKKA